MKILEKTLLADSRSVRIARLVILSPQIAAKARPGQFVVLMVSEVGERIPLTIVEADPKAGTIVLIAQAAGLTTGLLAQTQAGDSLYSLVGPLGHATEIKKYGTVVLVGGGVGIAEILPVARAMKASGNTVISIIGSRSKDLLILEDQMRRASDELLVMTDDGTAGKKGFVTQALAEVLASARADLVYAVGPIPMMRAVSEVSRDKGVRTIVSLNALMVDGTGMCGCCRVTVGGAVKFSCVDGPEFDASQVDWQELVKRSSVYSEKEKHICKLGLCA